VNQTVAHKGHRQDGILRWGGGGAGAQTGRETYRRGRCDHWLDVLEPRLSGERLFVSVRGQNTCLPWEREEEGKRRRSQEGGGLNLSTVSGEGAVKRQG